jgi:hypothetical protein
VISEVFQTRLIYIISIQFVLYCFYEIKHRTNSVDNLYYKIEFESLSLFPFLKIFFFKKKAIHHSISFSHPFAFQNYY